MPANRGVLSPLFLGPTVAVVGRPAWRLPRPLPDQTGGSAGGGHRPDSVTRGLLRGLATTGRGIADPQNGLLISLIYPLAMVRDLAKRHGSLMTHPWNSG